MLIRQNGSVSVYDTTYAQHVSSNAKSDYEGNHMKGGERRAANPAESAPLPSNEPAREPRDKALASRPARLVTASLEQESLAQASHSPSSELPRQPHELEAERQWYQELFDFAPDGYVITDTTGRIEEANRAAGNLLGIRQGFLAGESLIDFVSASDAGVFQSKLQALLQEAKEQTEEWEMQLYNHQGASFDASLTVTLVANEQRTPLALRWMIRDISVRKQAEEETRTLNTLLKQRVLERTIQLEHAQRHLAFLTQASTLLASIPEGASSLEQVAQVAVPYLADVCIIDVALPEQLIERHVIHCATVEQSLLVSPLCTPTPYPRDSLSPLMQEVWQGEAHILCDLEFAHRSALGLSQEQVAVLEALEVTSALLVPMSASGQILGTLTLLLTGAKRHYEPLDLDLAGELARLAALSVHNEQLAHEARAAIQARDEFLTIASHELKTPITTLQGYTELLQRRATREGKDATKDQRALGTIYRQAQRLTKLVESLLDMVRIQSGDLIIERSPIELTRLLACIVETFRSLAQNHTIQLNCPPELVVVEGDRARLERVFQHLLENAIKYSPQGGHIQVHLVRQEDHVCCTVVDHGIGIPSEALPQIFERFYRATNASEARIAGAGIGLYVDYHIVKEHGGTLMIESVEGEGTTATLMLPCAAPD